MSFTARLSEPTDFSTYYTERRLPANSSGNPTYWQYFYSGDYVWPSDPEYPYGAHTGNCTWYAMGRSAEIAGINLYSQFAGPYEAYNWNTIWTGHPAQTSGPINYLLGDILVYSNNNPDPDLVSGHVEIVEQIIGNRLTISYSAFSGTNPQSTWGTFFNVRKRDKMSFGDTPSVVGDYDSYFTRNSGVTYPLTSEYLIGVIHNPYADQNPATRLSPPLIAALYAKIKYRLRRRTNVIFR